MEFILNIVEIAVGVTAIIGVIIALCQWVEANRYKKAEILRDLMDKMREDDSFKIFNLIDHHQLSYDKKVGEFNIPSDEFKNDNLEVLVDKTLSKYNYICYLIESKVLTHDDIKAYEYELKKILSDFDLNEYMGFVSDVSVRKKSRSPFVYLERYKHKNIDQKKTDK